VYKHEKIVKKLLWVSTKNLDIKKEQERYSRRPEPFYTHNSAKEMRGRWKYRAPYFTPPYRRQRVLQLRLSCQVSGGERV